MTQFMEEIVDCRYIGEKQGVQNERTNSNKDQPLLDGRDVVPAEQIELSANVSKLTSGRWLRHITVLHTPPQK